MVILGNATFGNLETGRLEDYMFAGSCGNKNSVSVMLDFKNDSLKTIESVSFFFLPFNAIHRVVLSKARGQGEAQLKLTGSILPNEIKRQVYWENVWYSREIVHVRLTRISIAYTDGSTESLKGHQIHFDNT